MICTHCGARADADAKFCAQCGNPLSVRCANCDAEIPEGAQFCPACGTPVARSEAVSAAEHERRIITVLFADLAGFTASAEQADPEDVRARLSSYHAQVGAGIERFGGRVEKLLGDGVFAVFGAPVAHEDDPERGVRAALRIQEAVALLNESDRSLELAVRIAVTTGEAVVRLAGTSTSHEGIVGDVVNTASRLQQVAPTGGVVVDQRTYRASDGLVEFRELEPVIVKGKTDPIPIWLATSVRSRFGVDTESEATPFVGRQAELSLLQDTFTRAVRESSAQLVTLTGEPGVGKTRLVAELSKFIDDLPELVWWRQGRCLPYGEGITFWALGEVVKAQAGILESESTEVAADKVSIAVEALFHDPADREWMKLRLAPLVGTQAGEPSRGVTRSELFNAWLQFLEALAAVNPLVMVIEDLHWADPTLIEFLDFLIDGASAVPIMIIATARPELYDVHPGWGAGKRNAATLALTPLPDADIARLISALLDEAILPAEAQRTLLERCGGNPLHAAEFVRMLVERELLERDGRRLTIRGAMPLPESLQALIAARVDTLTVEEKGLLHAASVVGKVFWLGCVVTMTGIDTDAASELLRSLSRKEMIRPIRRSSMEAQDEFTFWHALVRDVSYSQIPRGRRAELHSTAAGWIEAASGSRVTDVAELLAFHHTEALRLAEAAGLDLIESARADAKRFLRLAGDRAKELDAEKSLDFYHQVLDLTRPGDPGRGEILRIVGEAEKDAGTLERAIEYLELAVAELAATGDRLGEAVALVRLSTATWWKGNASAVDQLDGRALELIDGLPPSAEVAVVLANTLGSRFLRGDLQGTVARADHVLEVCLSAGDPQEVARVYGLRGLAHYSTGDHSGMADVDVALKIALEHGLTRSAVVTYNNMADAVLFHEGPERSLLYLDKGIRLAEQRGLASDGQFARLTRLESWFHAGRWDELLADATQLAAEAEAESQMSVGASSWMTPVWALRGEAHEVLDAAVRAVAKARDIQDAQWAKTMILASTVFEETGHQDEVVPHLDEFAKMSEGSVRYRLDLLPIATRLLVAHGEIDKAAALHAGLSSSLRYGNLSLLSCQGLVAHARGDWAQAGGLYRAAAEGWHRFGDPHEEGHAWLGLAQVTESADEQRDAFAAARLLFDQLGAVVSLEAIDAAQP